MDFSAQVSNFILQPTKDKDRCKYNGQDARECMERVCAVFFHDSSFLHWRHTLLQGITQVCGEFLHAA